MLPTMKVGTLALIWRISAKFRLRRGMIVFFRRPNGERWLKRVIGLPGDRVVYRLVHRQARGVREFRINDRLVRRSLQPKQVVLSWIARDARGKRLKGADGSFLRRRETYRQYTERLPNGVSYRILHRPRGDPREFDRRLVVPPGRLFVLGDNRLRSFDSRQPRFGLVPRRVVLGLALCVVTRDDQMKN